MSFPERPIAYVLAASNHSTMIVNRNDVAVKDGFTYAVGHQLLNTSGAANVRLGSRAEFRGTGIVFYALAGNLAINNCMNARAKLAALGERVGEIEIPQPIITRPEVSAVSNCAK